VIRPASPRAFARALIGLLLVCICSTAVANAAGLNLVASGSPVYVTGDQRCGTGPLTVSPSGTPVGGQYTQVTVSGIVGTCSVGGVAVVQAAPPNTVLFSGTGPVSGSSFTASSTAFTPPATADGVAYVSLDGWIVPATWSFTPPVPPSNAISCRPVDPNVNATCTVLVTGWNFWGTGYRVDFSIITTSLTPFRWEARFDISQQLLPLVLFQGYSLFPGYPVPAGPWWSQWTPSRFTHSNLCTTTTNAQLPVVWLRGPHHWNRNVSALQPATSMGFQVVEGGNPNQSGALGTSKGIPTCTN
jgi:hypothetical protein